MIRGNLLIVDDETLLLKRLKLILEDLADQIFIASNGEEAIKILSQNKIHCVICDINMPKMTGVDVIKEVRLQKNEVPFIFYTGHGNRELLMEVAKYGAFDFLSKPDLNGLEEVVKRGLAAGHSMKKPQETSAASEDYQKLLLEID